MISHDMMVMVMGSWCGDDGDVISEYDVQWCDDDGDVNMMLWRWDHNVMMTVMESLYDDDDDDDDDSDGDGISMW